jgi:hypothetical protein
VYDSNPEVDFVLRSPLTSFQSKADIIKEIKASSQFLMLGRDSKLVFHRNTAEDRVKVTRKALANGELIITNDCTYKVIDRRIKPSGNRVNFMKAYLSADLAA